MASKKKTVSAVVAVALAAAILLGGTFAWQSISQEALNEVYGFVNPGGRLHDDFHEITYDEYGNVATDPATGNAYETRHFDKNVYVENFTTMLEDGVQIFARVRLDEYMEIGAGAGTSNADKTAKSIDPTNPNATFENMDEWRTRLPSDTDNPFQKYWTWDMAGDEATGNPTDGVTYMPTFNKNKDSLEADVNGTFGGGDKDNATPEDAFGDYVDYDVADNHRKTDNAVYDNDSNEDDELLPAGDSTLEEAVNNGDVITEEETHEIAKTLTSKVITMEEWLKNPVKGDFWVWDEDGWAYWANPINPDSATGIFLDGIARTEEIINEEWYYGINVVAQFITADHLGRDDRMSGFYTDMKEAPSYNALKLLNTIGVNVNTTVGDVDTLDAALALGGDITLGTEPIVADSAEEVANVSTNFNWHGGGTLNGGTLVAGEPAYAGLFINNEKNWPVNGDDAVAATVNDTVVQAGADVTFAVYAQAVHENVTLNNMTVTAQNGGILAEWNNDEKPTTVTLNNVSVIIGSGHSTDWVNSAVAAANGANVVINGGTYEGKYAAYVYSSGGTITINDGTFTGALRTDAGNIVIKGGTFTDDPTAYVPEGYTVAELVDADGNLTGYYEVSKIVF